MAGSTKRMRERRTVGRVDRQANGSDMLSARWRAAKAAPRGPWPQRPPARPLFRQGWLPSLLENVAGKVAFFRVDIRKPTVFSSSFVEEEAAQAAFVELASRRGFNRPPPRPPLIPAMAFLISRLLSWSSCLPAYLAYLSFSQYSVCDVRSARCLC